MSKKENFLALTLALTMLFNIVSPAAAFAQSNLPVAGTADDAFQIQSAEADPPPPPLEDTPYFEVEEAGSINGETYLRTVISSPPQPPVDYVRTTTTDLPERHLEAGINTISQVPAFIWSFGCSATSAAMIAGYHDRTFFANMYTGPTNNGVAPMNNSSWGTWIDSYGDTRAQMPLSASRQGLDGLSTKGHVDDYWRGFGNADNDPFLGNWVQHKFGDSVGDYMRTSQSNFGNPDGSTSFYTWSTNPAPFTCSQMISNGINRDGAVGVKNFYEARGYTVTDCYTQRTDLAGGFNFANYKAEIDAGYPVMFHVHGHTMVGIGYNDSGQTMYIYDTWDYSTHTMTWGGSYAGMSMYAVSIIHPEKETLDPGIHNSNHADITYSTGWEQITNPTLGYYDNDFHLTSTPGSYANFSFDGGKFKVIHTKDVMYGNMNVYVDGTLAGTISQYNSTFTPQSVWTSADYAPGIHTVRLEFSSAQVNIDAIEIVAPCLTLSLSHTGSGGDPVASPTKSAKCDTLGEYNPGELINLTATPASGYAVHSWTGTNKDINITPFNSLTMPARSHSVSVKYAIPPGPGIYQDTNTNIRYTGDWTIWNDSRTSGGSGRYSNDRTASAALAFSGRQVSLIFTRYTTRGYIEVTIDSGTPVLVGQYGSSLSFQNRWDSPVMDEGIHTVVFRHPGGSHYIDIDAIIISSPDIEAPAAVNLSAATGSNLGQVDLSWIAPGDDDNTGTATTYIVRYASSAIDTQAKWDAATNVTGEPAPLVAGTPQSMTVSGLVPARTYFFAIRTEDEAGNISPLSNSPSAESQAPVPVGPGTYQNGDPNILYTGNWTNWNEVRTSGGSTQFSNNPAASAALTFSGRRISLIYTSYTSRGNVEITIDGGPPVLLNQYGSSLSFQNRWDSPMLADGTHTIVLRHPGGSHYIDLDALIVSNPEIIPPAAVVLNAATGSNNGEIHLSWIAPGDDGDTGTATAYMIRYSSYEIDSLESWNKASNISGVPAPQIAGTVQSMTISNLYPWKTYHFALRAIDDEGNISELSNSASAPASGPATAGNGIYEDTDSHIYYSGTWTTWQGNGPSGNSTTYSAAGGSSALLKFTGTRISLIYTSNSNRGDMNIFIDNKEIKTLNQFSNTIKFQNRWDSPILAEGTHTLRLAHLGGPYHFVDIDAIIVSSPEPHPPAAVVLNAATGSNNGQVDLNWIAPGDDGNTGTATTYFVRYASSPINTQTKWDAATNVTGAPIPLEAGTPQSMTVSGLIPGQIYFFALRTLDDCDNLSPLSNSPSAQAKPPVPVVPGTYQNGDPNIFYTGNWTNWNEARASGGSTQYSNDPAASATLTFSGRQVSLLFTRFTSRGNIEITIDGGTPVLVNQYGASLTFQNRWDSPLMDAGTHTVVLRHPGGTKYIDLDAIIISDPESIPPAAVTLNAATGSNNGQVDLNWIAPGDDGDTGTATTYFVRYASSAIDSQAKWDAATNVTGAPAPLVAGTPQSMTVSGLTPGQTYFFALRTLDDSNNLSDLSNSPSAQAKPIAPVTEGMYQENDPNIIYTGNWQTWSDAQASGGKIKYSNNPAASATLTFTGEQIRLIYTRYTTRGDIVILIDDYLPLVFNQYGPNLVYQNWLTIYGLPAGTHTIQFLHPGGTHYIDIDALQVFTVSTYSSSEISEEGSFAVDINELD